MYRRQRAADAAKALLHNASQRLLTTDPTDYSGVVNALDQSLDWSLDADVHNTACRDFEPSFSESMANNLAFQVTPGGVLTSPRDRKEISTGVMQNLVGHYFGPSALKWLDGRIEPMRGRYSRRDSGMGAMFSLGMDRSGLSEASIAYEWGPDVLDSLPAPVFELNRIALENLPGIVPFYTTIRCGRNAGGQQVSFDIERALPLADLEPLMTALGLGQRHGGLVSLTGFILGARFTLPPKTSVLSLLNTRHGVEMRLDINLDALPDTPVQLLPLLRLPMTERPKSLQALDRWVTALTPEGYYGPGNVSVLSIRVRKDMPARVALYLRPIAFQPEQTPTNDVVNGNQVQRTVNHIPPGELSPEQMPV
jgi:hypothetical protein